MEGAELILDTHTLLWMDRNDSALGPVARQHIESAWRAGSVAVSAISFWEVAMLAERGRIELPKSADHWRADWLQAGLVEIPVNGRIALLSCELSDFHRDPADRFIVATAMVASGPLMTADQKILNWQSDLERIAADL